MIFSTTPQEKEIFELISQSAEELGYPSYVVGGYVRDKLISRPSKDIDIVCVGSGIELAESLASKLRPIPRIVVYRRFGTAMMRHKDIEIEFVGARKESYVMDSRKPTVEEGSLEQDQNRRDFTINALAVSLNSENFGEIIDPFDGLYDLENKIIKTPLDPGNTFSDDPLRMMRAIRFCNQLGFEIDDEVLASIAEYRYRISIVSKERITKELEKILMCAQPSVGFKLLYDTGLLELIFPEMCLLQGVEIRNKIGHKDNFYHTLQVVDNIAKYTDNIWLRWAALLHDIAKPATKRFNESVGWTFHGHEVVGANMIPRIFKNLRLPLDHKMKYVQKLVRYHLRPISLTKETISDSAIRRLLFDAGDDIDDLMTLCRADITSKNDNKVSQYLSNYDMVVQKMAEIEEKDHLRMWQPPIDGQEIMATFNLAPSEEVGLIKSAIREAILEGNIPNEHEKAYEFMLEYAQSIGIKLPVTEG